MVVQWGKIGHYGVIQKRQSNKKGGKMKFEVKYNESRSKGSYAQQDFELAKIFSKKVYDEFGEFIRAIILFGSTAKGQQKTDDVDILIVLDDVKIQFNEEIVQTYRVILQKIIANTNPKKLHIQSMKFTSFWEYVRAGDPVATNILRYGIALVDTGFFDPLQMLLDQGRIRPTPESIANYFAMSPSSLSQSKAKLMGAGIDLYWCVINSAHAALMHHGEVPPSPEHVVDVMKATLVKDKKISAESVKTMDEIYKLFKDITIGSKREFTGKEYDIYSKKAEKFMKEMDKYIRKK